MPLHKCAATNRSELYGLVVWSRESGLHVWHEALSGRSLAEAADLLIDLLVELLLLDTARIDRWCEAVELIIVTRVTAHVAVSDHRILEAGTKVRVLVHHVRSTVVARRLLALSLLPKLTGLMLLLVLVVELRNKA